MHALVICLYTCFRFHFSKVASPFWELGKTKDPATDTASLKQSNWYGEAMKIPPAIHFKWEAQKCILHTQPKKQPAFFL
ncbi:MAG: hypothetical protein IPP81_13910 [Chitinophagaceae bacterium]|nr:hypothetical protein [Chitinophagaceae bacterium]